MSNTREKLKKKARYCFGFQKMIRKDEKQFMDDYNNLILNRIIFGYGTYLE